VSKTYDATIKGLHEYNYDIKIGLLTTKDAYTSGLKPSRAIREALEFAAKNVIDTINSETPPSDPPPPPPSSGNDSNDDDHGLYSAANLTDAERDFLGLEVDDVVLGPDAQDLSDNSGGGNDDGGKPPIILDLDGDGVELVDIDDSTAFFDINGDGFRTHMGWAAADDGFLAYDIGKEGVISEGPEISFVSYVEGAQTDLEGLAYFDTNNDGVLNADDAEWSKFGVWQDLDQDGETDDGEFKPLADWNIESISLTSDGVEEDIGSNHVFGTGSYTLTSGETRDIADTSLATSQVGYQTHSDGSFEIQADDSSGTYMDGGFSDLEMDLGKLGYMAGFGFDGADKLTAGVAADVLTFDPSLYSGRTISGKNLITCSSRDLI